MYIETQKELLMRDFSEPSAPATLSLSKGRYNVEKIPNPSGLGNCIVLRGTKKGFTEAEVYGSHREQIHLMQKGNW